MPAKRPTFDQVKEAAKKLGVVADRTLTAEQIRERQRVLSKKCHPSLFYETPLEQEATRKTAVLNRCVEDLIYFVENFSRYAHYFEAPPKPKPNLKPAPESKRSSEPSPRPMPEPLPCSPNVDPDVMRVSTAPEGP